MDLGDRKSALCRLDSAGQVVERTSLSTTELALQRFAVRKELGIPVKFVGLGEGPDDLAPFDARAFAEGLLR